MGNRAATRGHSEALSIGHITEQLGKMLVGLTGGDRSFHET